jgi:hypothetical protein
MVQRPLVVTLALLLCAGSGALTHAADLYVICNPNVALAPDDIRDVFLGDKQFAGAVKLTPVDNSAAQEMFLEKVMKMSAARYSTAWTKKSFREGVNPPPMEGSDAETLAYVRRTSGACGYLTTAGASGVVIVSQF